MTSPFYKESLNNVRADHQHRPILAQISKKWKKMFHFLEKYGLQIIPRWERAAR
jgi:hypothetical protein